jgi:hypothetical protein
MASSLIIGTSPIRQLDDLYSLNDLHVASGSAEKDRPSHFLRNDQTKALVSELENVQICAFKILQGRNGGTYACKELVIAYAAWISPAFHLKVIRVFLAEAGRTLQVLDTITKEQQGKLATLIAERFPSGKDRPYAWSRFNNHFRLASYKDLPANRFDEACEYIKTMQEPVPALPKQGNRNIDLSDPDYIVRTRQIALQYFDDFRKAVKEGTDTPTMDIPADVLVGMLAGSLWRHQFVLNISHEGKVQITPMPDPFDTVTKIISDTGWANLEKIRKVFDACMNALSRRFVVEKA